MTRQELQTLVKGIVFKAYELKNKFTDAQNSAVNYACVFAQSQEEYQNLIQAATGLGQLVKEQPNGLLFALAGITMIAGTLKLLKIRQPDPIRPEMGDADLPWRITQVLKQLI